MNINGYIPSRQRIDLVPTERSFEELAWGPSLMMAKQAGLQKELSDYDAGLNFDYNQIDDPTISPLVEDLQKGLYDISSKIATQGFTPQTAQEVQAYKQRYNKLTGLQGPIGRAVKNQKDINTQWSAWDKTHTNDPLTYRNKAKEAMLSTYKGFQNGDFKPGDLPNYYDVNKDMLDVLTRAGGTLGKMVGMEGSSIRRDPTTNTFKVWNSNRGQFMDNSDALTGGATAILNDYMGAHGTETDRSKFAKMMGITPEYIESNLDALARSQRKASYSQLPSESASYQNIPQVDTGNKKTSNEGWGFPTYSDELTLGVDKDAIKTRDNIKSIQEEVNSKNIKSNLPEALAKQEVQDIAYKILSSNPNMGMDVALKNAQAQFDRTPSGKSRMFSDLKTNFSNLLLPNMSDAQFLSSVDSYLADRSANTSRLKSLDSEEAMKFLETNIGLDNKEALTRVKKGDKGGPENTSFSNFRKTFENETSFGRKQVFYDENLNTFIQDGNNNVYKVNKNLSDINPTVKIEHDQLRSIENSTKLTDEEIKQINQSPIKVIPGDLGGDQYVIRVGKDSSGKLVKQVKMFSLNPKTNQYDEKIVSLKDFADSYYPNKAMKVIFTDLSKFNE